MCVNSGVVSLSGLCSRSAWLADKGAEWQAATSSAFGVGPPRPWPSGWRKKASVNTWIFCATNTGWMALPCWHWLNMTCGPLPWRSRSWGTSRGWCCPYANCRSSTLTSWRSWATPVMVILAPQLGHCRGQIGFVMVRYLGTMMDQLLTWMVISINMQMERTNTPHGDWTQSTGRQF